MELSISLLNTCLSKNAPNRFTTHLLILFTSCIRLLCSIDHNLGYNKLSGSYDSISSCSLYFIQRFYLRTARQIRLIDRFVGAALVNIVTFSENIQGLIIHWTILETPIGPV